MTKKVAYVILRAETIYQLFLFVTNSQNVDAIIHIIKSIESEAKINILNNFLKIRINQLKAQLMIL